MTKPLTDPREMRKRQAEAAAAWKAAGCMALPGLSAWERNQLGLGPFDPDNPIQKAMQAYPGWCVATTKELL